MITSKLKAIARKYLSGTVSEEEKRKLHDWYDRAGDRPESRLTIASRDNKEQVRQRIYTRLQARIAHESTDGIKYHNRKYWFQGLAAAFILLFSVWIVSTVFRDNREEWLLVEVPRGKVKELLLPDSSVVWINAGSKLRYPRQFGDKERRIELTEGQAFFEVKRDESRPFFVRAGNVEVSVLGTSFDVKYYASEAIAKVSVRSGLVNVDYQGDVGSSSLKLQPGQQAVIDRKGKGLYKEAFAAELIAAWRDGRLAFENERVEYVFKALERRYNIDIAVLPEKLLHESISIKLEDQPLQDIMEVLKYTLGFNYEIIGGKTVKIKE